MSFVESQAVRAVLLLTLAALVFTGVAGVGAAVFLALTLYVADWAAAAIAGALFLSVAFGAAIIIRSRARPPMPKPVPVDRAEDATVAMIAGMAKGRPLLALLFAGLVGAAGTIIQHNSRVN